LKQLILGTAGHIDHGKTSLIKAMTGIDTDRLKEEKLRGITIELGFASIKLPSGQHIGIVDVPGHEKFVKNMVAGATGIDIVALIVAADEGVMPQTREHMEICTLLGIKHGIVVLTKIDLVDDEWMELVTEDVREFVQGSFLEDAPVVHVSSTTGQGIKDIVNTLDKLSSDVPERPRSSLFRLPVDRVFTMKGFGTVITGTIMSGKISVGDMIMVYPNLITSKVRGLQVHGESVNEAESGMRTAINFQGLERTSVNRGDVLAFPDTLKQSYMLDISVHYLKSNTKALKNRTQLRFHIGTRENMGTLVLLDREELHPGETIEAQIRLDSTMTCVKDDRFVLRSYSPVKTIGGGQILNPVPRKHRLFDRNVTDGLKSLVGSNNDEIISYHVDQAGNTGISFSDLKIMANLPEKQLQSVISGLLSSRTLIQVDKEKRIFIHLKTLDRLSEATIEFLTNYHKSNPLKTGMPKEELKSKYRPSIDTKLFNLLLNQMIKNKEVITEEDTVRLEGYKIALQVDQEDIRKKIINVYIKSDLKPPYFKALCSELGVDVSAAGDVLLLLVKKGDIIKAKDDLYFHSGAIDNLKKRLVEFLKENGEITTPQLKEITGVSRKYTIPLIEYFDSQKITLRIGDVRKLRI